MPPVIGIDLGTTNSLVACMRDGVPTVLADERGVKLMPSVISIGEPDSLFQVNTVTPKEQLYSAVATNASGDFIVSWSSKDVREECGHRNDIHNHSRRGSCTDKNFGDMVPL